MLIILGVVTSVKSKESFSFYAVDVPGLPIDFVFTKEGICKGVQRHSFHCGAAYRLIYMIGGVCLILEDAVHYDSSPAMRICMNKMCAA